MGGEDTAAAILSNAIKVGKWCNKNIIPRRAKKSKLTLDHGHGPSQWRPIREGNGLLLGAIDEFEVVGAMDGIDGIPSPSAGKLCCTKLFFW